MSPKRKSIEMNMEDMPTLRDFLGLAEKVQKLKNENMQFKDGKFISRDEAIRMENEQVIEMALKTNRNSTPENHQRKLICQLKNHKIDQGKLFDNISKHRTAP